MRGEALFVPAPRGRPLPLRATTQPQPIDPARAGACGARRGSGSACADRLEQALGAPGPERRHVVLWPAVAGDVPDDGDVFRVAYLPPEWSSSEIPLERWVLDGSGGPRINRNALCLVEPDAGRFDAARAAARRALAVEALLSGEDAQISSPSSARSCANAQRRAEGELRTALGHAYVRVQVPTGLAEDGSLRFASRELATILATGRTLHERVREALENPCCHQALSGQGVALAELGLERQWRWVLDVAHALPQFLDAPKVWTPAALSVGIAEGVQHGAFGYAANAAEKDSSITVASSSSVRLREPLAPEQINLGDGAAL